MIFAPLEQRLILRLPPEGKSTWTGCLPISSTSLLPSARLTGSKDTQTKRVIHSLRDFFMAMLLGLEASYPRPDGDSGGQALKREPCRKVPCRIIGCRPGYWQTPAARGAPEVPAPNVPVPQALAARTT